MKKFVIKIIIVFLSLICFLWMLEVSSQAFLKKTNFSHGPVAQGIGNLEIEEYPDFYIKDKDLFWRLEKSAWEINSLGLRDREVAPKKEANTIRIICIGDSITYGWPAPLDKTYPRILEAKLKKERPDKRIEVLNAGVPGYTSYQGMLWLEKELINYSPDIVIAYFGVNDSVVSAIEDKEYKMPPAFILKAVNYLKRFSAYRLYKKIIMHLQYVMKKNDEKYDTVRVTEEDFTKNLAQLSLIAEQANCQIIFIDNAVFYNTLTKTIFTRGRYKAPAGSDAINIYDMITAAKTEYSELFVDDCRPHNFHLTEKGQEILAQKIQEFIVKSKALEKVTHE